MRIVIIAGGIPVTTFIDSFINGMAERGYTMIVIGRKTGIPNYGKNVEIVEIPQSKRNRLIFILANVFKAGITNIGTIYKNSKSLKLFFNDLLFYLPIIKANPDKVHLQWGSTLYSRELLFNLFPGKVLLSLRGSHINYTPVINSEMAKCYKRVFPMVQKFHAVSKAIGREAETYGARKERIHTIYTSVGDEILQREIVVKEKHRQLSVIAVGRFHWVKGYNYLIDALGIVKKRNIDFKLILVAGKNIPEEISYNIHQSELGENIQILDGLAHNSVLKHIANADLMVLPSVNEGIANVVVEAMALGTPVISSDCGGMNEVIENGINGFLFENRNANDLAERIIQFSNLDNKEKEKIALNARKTVSEKFSRNRMLDEFEKFYN